MEKLLDLFLFFKDDNFTIKNEIQMGVHRVWEYVYNMKRYFTDTWPPNLRLGAGPPIRSVTRDDGVDVTERVIKFSGPRRNYINPLSLYTIVKKWRVTFHFMGVKATLEDNLKPYEGGFMVTDTLGQKRAIKMRNDGLVEDVPAYISS